MRECCGIEEEYKVCFLITYTSLSHVAWNLRCLFVPLFQESVDTSDGEDHDDEAVIHVPSGDSDFDFESDDSGSEEEQSK